MQSPCQRHANRTEITCLPGLEPKKKWFRKPTIFFSPRTRPARLPARGETVYPGHAERAGRIGPSKMVG